MEALYEQIASFDGEGDLGPLLVDLGECAQAVAARHAKVVKTEETPLPHCLLCIAALSELAAARSLPMAKTVPTVCASIGKAREAHGSQISDATLASIIRACASLSLLVAAPVPSLDATTPPPLQTCIEALEAVNRPLGGDALGLLKSGIAKLWQHPMLAEDSAKSSQGLSEMIAQMRLRRLLHTVFLKCPKLVGEVDARLCISLSHGAGLKGSLDFLLLLAIVRKMDAEMPKTKGKKRKGAGTKEAVAALMEVMPQLVAEEDVVDEVLAILSGVDASSRIHCMATFSRTLCRLALQLRRSDDRAVGLTLGPSLIPKEFVADLGVDKAWKLLKLGLALIRAYYEREGLPGGMDDVDADLSTPYPVAGLEDVAEPQGVPHCAPVAVCYMARSLVIIETLHLDVPAEDAKVAECATIATEVRTLLFRSLAVNHPRTFFRAAALSMLITDLAPNVEKKTVHDECECSRLS
jgi:hypothetical protein